ncbi:peptide-methionine (S)-S-oxide reductase [Pseudoalteromonas sp. SMS1]|uniref:peptide-methionine (S)-S-oxide reductase n=1 Tax=Pseudoalteromonas sp. SMS1 TaxID=2908894 RepID=UPI001F43F70F|nr:peptide-methionine (S)-S-oxide reductase [Pseudoalteromonas sp. SMS1]MCF2858756.1 peptide-methionine (S)-S-oxide reductase [Pseudoalteromonas sp. SMS1]
MIEKLGLGGSCYWCTEAIFGSLRGVKQVTQGWVNSFKEQSWFSEGIILDFDNEVIKLRDLIEIHLYTHSATSNHSRRNKYRSAVYCFEDTQYTCAVDCLIQLQPNFDNPVITKALMFNEFKPSPPHYQNYFYTDPKRPFCKNVITPKLKMLISKFGNKVEYDQVTQALSTHDKP